MKIVIPKFLLFVMMTTAVAAAAAVVAADSSSSTLATKLAIGIEEEKSLLDSVEGATITTTTTTTTTPLLSSSLSSLVEVFGATPKLASFTGTDSDDDSAQRSLTITGATTVSDSTLPAVGYGHPVTRGDRSSSTTGTRPHTVASDDSGGRLSSTGTDASASNDVVNLYLHAVVDAINGNDKITSFTGTDGSIVSAPRKLIKSSKKVNHPEALCTLSLFADSLFLYANQCFSDIMVTISACDDEDDTCYISEHLPLLPQEEQEEQEEQVNQEEEQCFVGGSFPAKENIQYNPSTGDCEFLYVDLVDDPCNSYIGDTGTGSLGLKARINVKNNPDVMFIQFTEDKGLTFYNAGDERVAKKHSPTHNVDRYLRQEGATKPVLSMMPHPFASRRLYYKVALKNDTPYEVNSARIEYCAELKCAKDENNFIASGGTWTPADYRGACLVTEIRSSLIIDGREVQCAGYSSSGTGYWEFFLMWIDGVCCLRSWAQDSDKCPEPDIDYCDPSVPPPSPYTQGRAANYNEESFCKEKKCAHRMWADGCEACMCFNNGNAAWCDGLADGRGGHYYDKYFEEHGENPWGDTNVRNRKCNTDFRPEGSRCDSEWQCEKGFTCIKKEGGLVYLCKERTYKNAVRRAESNLA